MSATSMPKPLLAFFGATGGCTLAALAPALQAGYDCTALCRTPSKLTTLLLAKGVPQATLDAHLHITSGNVLDVASVKQCLTLNDRHAAIIISGIGITNLSEARKRITLCASALTNILTALKDLPPTSAPCSEKPLIVAISSTGLTKGKTPRDLPLLMMPMYKYMLANPHEDKIRMEEVVEEHVRSPDCAIRGYVLPRPSLLLNGAAKGTGKVKVGTVAKPAVGYTINRDDVGLWIYEKLVVEDGGTTYRNEKPTLTQ